jgi:hypothetical protein
MWSLDRIRVKHTCIAYIAKSNIRSMEKNIIHSRSRCAYSDENKWKWTKKNPISTSVSIFFGGNGIRFRKCGFGNGIRICGCTEMNKYRWRAEKLS